MHPQIHPHLDAPATLFFGDALKAVKARTYDTRFPELKGRTFVPLDNEGISANTNTIEYTLYTAVGMAKIISSYADDLPRVDLYGEKFTASVRDIGDSYGWNIREIRASAETGTGLPQKRADIARRAIEQTIDVILAVGDSRHGLLGLLNQPNALGYVVPNGGGGSPLWTAKDQLEILADLHASALYIVTQTKGAEVPDSIIMSPERYGLLATTFLEDSTQTILQAFLATSPYIRNVDQWSKCSTAGAGGTQRLVIYRRDPSAVSFALPEDFNQLDPEPRNLEVIVNCLARMGGVVATLPLSMAYADGI